MCLGKGFTQGLRAKPIFGIFRPVDVSTFLDNGWLNNRLIYIVLHLKHNKFV